MRTRLLIFVVAMFLLLPEALQGAQPPAPPAGEDAVISPSDVVAEPTPDTGVVVAGCESGCAEPAGCDSGCAEPAFAAPTCGVAVCDPCCPPKRCCKPARCCKPKRCCKVDRCCKPKRCKPERCCKTRCRKARCC